MVTSLFISRGGFLSSFLGGASVNLLNEMASSMGFEVLGSGLSFPQAYTKEKCNMAEIAALIKG